MPTVNVYKKKETGGLVRSLMHGGGYVQEDTGMKKPVAVY